MDLNDSRLDVLIGGLTLERKVQLLTGRDFWSTWPLEEIGLRSMVFSDGPAGVRGPVWDERSPSLSLPSGTALAASWDPQVAREYGNVSASEARRKGADVVLGPTINLHRSPLGGRHFEALSEDPALTAQLAASYVDGVQESGVGATPKHYIANDFETDRFTADVQVSDRALRELYLLAFEQAVSESKAWLVMSAYNSINGATATENELLETPLNTEWGFDGVVVSDWTAVRSVNSARYSQDLVMPGPDGAWGTALVEAVVRGDIAESVIDRKVRRLLLLAARVGALEGFEESPVRDVDGVAFARRAASAGMVLVENDGILPIRSAPGKIAVIGHNATVARTQGGGSATVIPERVISPLEGITAAFPQAQLDYALGAVVQEGVTDISLAELQNPATGDAGVHLRFLNADGQEIFAEERLATSYVWFGGDAPVSDAYAVEVTTVWTPTDSRSVRLGFSGVGRGVVTVDGAVLVDEVAESIGTDLGAALLAPPTRSAALDVTAGASVAVTVRYEPPRNADDPLAGAMAFSFGLEADSSDPEGLLSEAEELAAAADIAVLVVGTNSRVESEGYDRTDLRLPGLQDELARRVLNTNPRTVVVVNAGSPVELPWADEAAAIVLAWFGGQEFGAAIGDVLSGAEEPGGRLPTTWPIAERDVPVLDVTPVDGVVRYDEGIHIGYRAWLKSSREPRWWFGSGQGYATFETGQPEVTLVGETVEVRVPVRNISDRRGKHVVQIYASRPNSTVDRPVRWLVGFEPMVLDAGASGQAQISVPVRALAHWSENGWAVESGEYTISVGATAGDITASAEVAVNRIPSLPGLVPATSI